MCEHWINGYERPCPNPEHDPALNGNVPFDDPVLVCWDDEGRQFVLSRTSENPSGYQCPLGRWMKETMTKTLKSMPMPGDCGWCTGQLCYEDGSRDRSHVSQSLNVVHDEQFEDRELLHQMGAHHIDEDERDNEDSSSSSGLVMDASLARMQSSQQQELMARRLHAFHAPRQSGLAEEQRDPPIIEEEDLDIVNDRQVGYWQSKMDQPYHAGAKLWRDYMLTSAYPPRLRTMQEAYGFTEQLTAYPHLHASSPGNRTGYVDADVHQEYHFNDNYANFFEANSRLARSEAMGSTHVPPSDPEEWSEDYRRFVSAEIYRIPDF